MTEPTLNNVLLAIQHFMEDQAKLNDGFDKLITNLDLRLRIIEKLVKKQ